MMQGWLQSTLNGSNLSWGYQLGVGNTTADLPALHRQAGTNASVYLIAAGACFLADPLQARLLGRRGMLFTAAVLCLAAGVGAACTEHWTQLLGCRVLLGIAMGLKASVTSVFAAEVSPCHLRGMIVMGWQAGDALGIFLGFTANLVAAKATSNWHSSWRWQTASIAIPALCLMVLIFTIPDSPRLYLRRGNYKKAYEALCLLRPMPLQAARDLFYANAQLQIESDHLLKRVYVPPDETGLPPELDRYQQRVRRLSWWQRLRALGQNDRTRRALSASLILMIAQQFSGFNVLAFYSNNYFSFDFTPDDPSLPAWLSFGIGLCNFAFTIPAFFLIDRGRVSLVLATYPFMIVIMLASSLVFATAGTSVPKVPIIVLAFFFTAVYSLGQGPVPFTYSAEVFPLVYRESGMSVAVAANLFFAGLLTLFAPQAQFAGPASSSDPQNCTSDDCDLSQYNKAQASMLGVFVVLEVVAFCLIFLFVPETARCKPSDRDTLNHMSLEELNTVFEATTFRHTMWRIQEATPARAKWVTWWLTSRDPVKEPPMAIQVHRWRSEKAEKEGSQPGTKGVSTSQDLLDQSGANSSETEEVTGDSSQARHGPTSTDDAIGTTTHGGNLLIRAYSDGYTPVPSTAHGRPRAGNPDDPMVFHLNEGTTMPAGQGPRARTRRFY